METAAAAQRRALDLAIAFAIAGGGALPPARQAALVAQLGGRGHRLRFIGAPGAAAAEDDADAVGAAPLDALLICLPSGSDGSDDNDGALAWRGLQMARAMAERAAQRWQRAGQGGAIFLLAPPLADDAAEAADAAAGAMLRGALTALIQHLAARYAAHGVRLNAIVGQEAQSLALVAALLEEPAAALSGQVMQLSPTTTATTATTATTTGPRIEAMPNAAAAPRHDAIAVVGMGVALPRASSPDELWQLLCGDAPVFGEPDERLPLRSMWSADPTAEDRTYSRVAGFLTDFRPHPRLRAELDAGTFTNPELTARWLRHCILQATEHVAIAGRRQLVAIGLTPDGSHHLEHSLVKAAAHQALAAAGGDAESATANAQLAAALQRALPYAADRSDDFLPYRIARAAAGPLPAGSALTVVDTACSSSLYTLDLGIRALRAGEVDVALCGGAFALNAQSLVLFSKLHGLSKSGQVRSLDGGADGVLFSDGAAMLALKTHARAVADGDPILGFLAGFGGSSDGRGKAIYAPNAAGQRLALHRAWAAAGVGPGDVDWVIAHATGTPTGDKTELTALTDNAPAGHRWTVTSNKSLVGHTGWAAGAVSVVHALLALRHQQIPAQRRFAAVPPGQDGAIAAAIDVPTSPRRWAPSAHRPRRVAVSAMGFGGTNGHLLLGDQPTPAAGPAASGAMTVRDPDEAAAAPDALVLTAWAAHLPGDPDEAQLASWLGGGAPSWPARFGERYPMPSPIEVRLAPSAIAAMDRTQLMSLRLAQQLDGAWAKRPELAARTGVFVGHSGPTRSAIGHDLRCYLRELEHQLPALDHARLRAAADAQVPPAREDSYPGLMPNIIAARVAQRLDLHGPNMTLDAGRDSVAAALATAARYLRDGEIELALVLGVHATPASAQLAAAGWSEQARDGSGVSNGREPADAAIGLMLTRRSVAEAHGLPILAELEVLATAASPMSPVTGVSTASPGLQRSDDGRAYRGAQGAIELLRALHQRTQQLELWPVEDALTPGLRVRALGAVAEEPAAQARPLPAASPEPVAALADVAAAAPEPAAAPALADVLTRHCLTLRPRPPLTVRPPALLLIEPTLIVTDLVQLADRLAALPLPDHCLVVSPPAADELAAVLRGRSFRHVVILADVTPTAEAPAAGNGATATAAARFAADLADLTRLTALNDLAFAAAQLCAETLRDGGSYTAALLGAFSAPGAGAPRPVTGLFTGLVRSLEQELPGCTTFALLTDETEPAPTLAALRAESAHHRHLPLAYHQRGQRLEQLVVPLPAAELPAPAAPARLPERPVVLATGGARGLTAHLVEQILADSQPRALWLLGTGPAPELSAPAPASRAEALRALIAQHPGENLARLNRRYDDAVHAAERAATLRRLIDRLGAGNVHYRQCDLLDGAAVQTAIAEVLAVEGAVDIVLHGAGLVRSAVLARKKLADLRAVRDVKTLGYARLRAAFGDRQPRLWCNLSSVSAFMGRLGEPDYCAGNEYLMLTAAHQRAVHQRDEVALVSALWVESGMASAGTVGGAFLARQGDIGQMTDAQGREFFAAELRGRGSHGLATTWIGDADWATLERKAPGFRDVCRAAAAASAEPPLTAPAARSPRRAFLHGARRVDEAAASATAPAPSSAKASWLVDVDLERHAYLLDHQVDARPTLPGTFILELATEAALEAAIEAAIASSGALAPGLVPAQLTDLVLSRFVRAPRDRWPRRLLVTAERLTPERLPAVASRAATSAAFAVRIASPAHGPVAELEHARVVVHLAPALAPAGGDAALASSDEARDPAGRPAPDAYCLPGSPVALAGVFGAMHQPRLLPDGGAATLRLAMPDGDSCFTGFALPSVALDALLRTLVLDGRHPDAIGVIVPTAIARIELFTTANDLELAAAWPQGLQLRHRVAATANAAAADDELCALTPDGRLLLRATGVTGAVRQVYDLVHDRWAS